MSVTPNRRAAFEALRLDRDDDDPRRAGDARATYGVETHTSCAKDHDGLPFQLVSAGPAVPSGPDCMLTGNHSLIFTTGGCSN
jgi:hypothetical protein